MEKNCKYWNAEHKDCALNYAEIRNKAIDEFAEKMKDANTTIAFVLYQADEVDLAEFIELAVDEIAEQMKEVRNE